MPLIPLFLKLSVPLDQPLKILLIDGVVKSVGYSVLHGARECPRKAYDGQPKNEFEGRKNKP
jgi:hypothetical protein